MIEKLTPEQREKQKERVIKEAELLKGGAEYSKEGRLEPTKEQIDKMRKEMIIEKQDEETKKALDKLRKELGLSPEKEIPTYSIKIGGKTKDQLIREMESKNIDFSLVQHLLNSRDFTTLEESEDIKLVGLSGADLGFSDTARGYQICQKAQELGLDLCPVEVGPHFRLQNQKSVFMCVGIEPIVSYESGESCIFYLEGSKELKAEFTRAWCDSNIMWVFSLPTKGEVS